jgi:CheY-like chemotaxis protein
MAKILIVDDSAMSRRILRRILETADHNVIEADDGMVAIEKYFLEKPDLVMLDLLMKGISGWRFCRRFDRWTRRPGLWLRAPTFKIRRA